MIRKSSKTKLSKKYKEKLRLRDFLGELKPDEVQIARENGLLRWDLWKKAQNRALTFELNKKGYLLAPVFNQNGQIDNVEYNENTKFLINDYKDL